MKIRDLQLYLRYSLSKDILLSFVRSNFLGLFLIFALLNVIDYYNYFERENDMLYIVLTGLLLLLALFILVTHKMKFEPIGRVYFVKHFGMRQELHLPFMRATS